MRAPIIVLVMNETELQALIARNPINPKYGVPVPLILICNVTGKETKYTAPEYIKGKLDAAGSLENLLKSYKCKGAGKQGAKQGATKSDEPEIPKSKQIWRGEAVSTKKETKQEDTAPTELMHREYKFKDGGNCHVYFPRQNPDQIPDLVVVHPN